MSDRVTVSRPTGGYSENDQGQQVPASAPVHVDVPAWIRPLHQQSRIVDAGGKPTTLLAYDLLVPHTVDDLQIDDLVTVTSSNGTDLQGRTLTVVDVTWGSHQVARRLVCQANLG